MINIRLILLSLLLINMIVSVSVVFSAEDPSQGEQHGEPRQELIPDHEIKYEDSLSPDWKTNWDIARSLYRENKFPEALIQYEILFTQKDNIEEARWEYY